MELYNADVFSHRPRDHTERQAGPGSGCSDSSRKLLFWIFGCLDGVQWQSQPCIIPMVTWDIEALGTRHPYALVPFFLHLNVSKLVLYFTSDPASQGSPQPCLPLFASLPFQKPPPHPHLILSARAVALPRKVHWFYRVEGSMGLGKRMGFEELRTNWIQRTCLCP